MRKSLHPAQTVIKDSHFFSTVWIFSHFQKLKLQLNATCKNGAGIDIKFIRGGKTPQRFDEEGELYCQCPNFSYCQPPKQNPNDPPPGTNGRSSVCSPQMPPNQDTYSMMYHKKMIISDNDPVVSSFACSATRVSFMFLVKIKYNYKKHYNSYNYSSYKQFRNLIWTPTTQLPLLHL